MPRKKATKGEWRKTIAKQAEKCQAFTGKVCVNVSGGDGSAVAWHRCLEWYGADRVIPVFADTNSEHKDLYRFLNDCEAAFGQKITRLNDGRNIWDVFDQTGMLRIARAGGACKASIELKQKPLDKHFKECGADAIAVGIEFQEPERMTRFETKLDPVQVLFPLAETPLLGECEIHDYVRKLGIAPCVSYDEGHGHNNCLAGGCILAGLNQWAGILKMNPEGFAYAEQRETVFADKTGFTILRDQSGGQVRPYRLSDLRADVEAGKKFSDSWKSQCNCMEPQPLLFTLDECFGGDET